MRNLLIVTVVELMLLALALFALVTMPPYYYVYVSLSLLSGVIVGYLYYCFGIPLRKIETGMDLLKAQDFSSQLCLTGQKDADKIINIFNGMMLQLRKHILLNQEQDYFLKQLIDASPMGVVTLDANERIEMINAAAMTFLKVGNDFRLKTSGLDGIDSELSNYLRGLSLGVSRVFRISTTECFRCSCLFFMDRGFRRRFYLIERMTDDIRRAEREAYGKVIRTIAHEVNNSMAATKSVLDITEAVVADEPDFVDAIESCRNRIESMTSFITKYASVVKSPPLTLQKQDLNVLIERNMAFYETMCMGTGVKISCRLSETEVVADIDRILIEQVLVNVVKNAVESCGQTGLVEISTEPNRVIVADNGKGISEEVAQNLFSPFFSTKVNGQGIGLMFAAEILRRHGFEFSLATDATDGITRFTIVLGR